MVTLDSRVPPTPQLPLSARAECIRDLVQEAQGLFMRGAPRLAEQRLQEALKVC
jgi:hypothetical protein